MRIVVATGLNSGAAEYKNMGDVAMLQVAVARLLNLWPEAQIHVLTDSASNLARFCPNATALSREACRSWVGDRVLLGRYHQLLPMWASCWLSALKRAVRLHRPKLIELLIRLRISLRRQEGGLRDFNAFLNTLKRSDLFVVCGSGGFTDSCKEWNLAILGTMEAAIRLGVPVALFGQGIGPLTDPTTLSKAGDVLPRVALIALRGNEGAIPLLETIGVPPAAILTTGDEAIELAYDARDKELGNAVGINLRVASYAGVKAVATKTVGAVLQQFARRHNAPLLPIPIAFHDCARDHETIRRLLAGFDDNSDGGLFLDTPLALIKQTARCRIVVTGAYHAAVFALAQGIPVVCLSNSPYYDSKFKGLEDLFGQGCPTVMLSDPNLSIALTNAMEKMYGSADALRSPLLRSAFTQIESGHRAYQRIKDHLEANTSHPPSVLRDAHQIMQD